MVNMDFLYIFSLIVEFFNNGVIGRPVNISTAWFLPQEGFPVFYRYFNDKVTWNEAEAVCGFHHADLLSVQTSNQMDAVQAYLKEIDVTENIWIGLQKDSPENPFSWTNGEKLLGDGYWTEPIPKTNEKLCAALDPVADFRWNSYYCGGPEVASFVCELPVPDWAQKENGCLITSLPSLTVTLLPEMGVIQLLSDCGLDGTRRIACNGAVNREEIIKRLSCDVDAFVSTISGRSTTDEVRGINTEQNFEPDASNQITQYKPAKTSFLSPQTRHRRSASLTGVSTTIIPFEGKAPSSRNASSNIPSHGFPHSPYLASVRNAPSTRRPHIVKIKSGEVMRKDSATARTDSPVSISSPPNDTKLLYKDLPVLIITEEKLNDSVSASSATSENPQIVLMIENKNLDESFLVPLSDDILVNNPSLSPRDIVNVDLVEVDNLTTNITSNETTPFASSEAPPAHTYSLKTANASGRRTFQSKIFGPHPEESLNTVQEEKGSDILQRPNRGRLLTHPSHPSFYPRFLNRVLG